MNSPPSLPTAEVAHARRKLIRAGFAVPAMATLASGSALAGTSASCFARQFAPNTQGVYPGVSSSGSSSTDTYMRVQLGKRTKNNHPDTFYVDGNNLADLLVANPRLIKSDSYALGRDRFQLFNIADGAGGNSEVGDVLTSVPNGGTYYRQGGKYAVLRFSSNGKIVGVGRSTSTGQSAVQQSCWSSLAP